MITQDGEAVRFWVDGKEVTAAPLAPSVDSVERATYLLRAVHPEHPQPEICEACVFLGRAALERE